MPTVEMYTKAFCPYCRRAKMLLESKRVDYVEHPVDGGGELKQAMISRAGGRMTVPQIFIDDRHIGGCDDLYELDRRGLLDEMLAA